MNDEQAFAAALTADRYDRTTRLVFADWLEERGRDDEAAWQRNWTREWQEGEDHLRAFAERHQIPYEDVIKAGHAANSQDEEEYFDNMFVQNDSQSAGDEMYDEAGREKFWAAWQAVTGREATDLARGRTVFDCSC